MADVNSVSPFSGAEQLLKYFKFDHLPEKLQKVSGPFCALAQQMVSTLPSGPELTAGVRKLLEAKDCCVRAAIYDE
jgi:hypothetical protein